MHLSTSRIKRFTRARALSRSQYDSPEVDQEILIPAAGRRLLRGRFYDVRITSAADYDLYGEVAGK